jgi:hypothetical protein
MFSGEAPARDQQKWIPVLRPIARQTKNVARRLSPPRRFVEELQNRFPLLRDML